MVGDQPERTLHFCHAAPRQAVYEGNMHAGSDGSGMRSERCFGLLAGLLRSPALFLRIGNALPRLSAQYALGAENTWDALFLDCGLI